MATASSGCFGPAALQDVIHGPTRDRPGGRSPASRVDPESLDPDSAEWLAALGRTDSERQAAQVRLHARLLRIARSEVQLSSERWGPEFDDMAHWAAAHAMVAITAKLGQFRGESRFTTWAYKFVIFEVSTKIGRHFWHNPAVAMDAEDWDRLPDRFGLDPARASEWRDVVAALHRAVDEVLTDRQQEIIVAIVLNAVPLDALVAELGTGGGSVSLARRATGAPRRPPCRTGTTRAAL